MRKTNYKIDSIKNYIIDNAPTRSELIKFIAVELNGVSESYFDAYPRSFRGYYATNITRMRNAGNIWSKDKKYYVTEQGITNENSLYYQPYKKQVRQLSKSLDYREKQYNKLRKQYNKLVRAVEIVQEVSLTY